MTSFIDKLRSAPVEDRKLVTVLGFDPDVAVLGWALIEGVVGGSRPARILRVHLHARLFPKGDAVDKLSLIASALVGEHTLCRGYTHAVIESQQLYPRKEQPRQEIIAKGNDLLRVAHVSGIMGALAAQAPAAVRVALPSEWKGQRTKPVDHANTLRQIDADKAPVLLHEHHTDQGAPVPITWPTNPGKWEHALDAAGMALYGLRMLAQERW